MPYREQMPIFQAFQEAHGNQVQVIAVDAGFADTVKAAAGYKKTGFTMPIAVDDNILAKVFNLRVTPQHVRIDRSVRLAYVGHSEDQELNDALQKLLSDDHELMVPVQAPSLLPVTDEAFKLGNTIKGLTVSTLEGKTVEVVRINTDSAAIYCLADSLISWIAASFRTSH